MKKLFSILWNIFKKLVITVFVLFVVTFTIYMTNAENKLIYYHISPFLTKHYDKQSRDRRI